MDIYQFIAAVVESLCTSFVHKSIAFKQLMNMLVLFVIILQLCFRTNLLQSHKSPQTDIVFIGI